MIDGGGKSGREHRTRPKTSVSGGRSEVAGPEFGPGGYLPPKAAKRARKIVLREQMGWGWPLAAVAASLLVAVAGGIFLLTSNRPPQAPFVALTALNQVDAAGAGTASAPGLSTVLVVRAGGVVRTFRMPETDVVWCSESRRLESGDAAWNPAGAAVFGRRASLTPLRSVVFDGTVYVDPAPLPAPASAPGGAAPACIGD
jgi:hypothetical protein